MKKLLFYFAFGAGIFAASAQQVWYVKKNGTGNQSGTSWQNAMPSIQMAINRCIRGNQIWVAQGIYKENLLINLPNQEGIELYGGFMGNETKIEQRAWRARPTIIDAGGIDQCIDIINVSGCRVDGFTLQRGVRQYPGHLGFAPASGITVYGCSVPCMGATPISNTVLKNLIIKGNTGTFGGGIHLQYTKNTLIQNVEVSGNNADEGAGIWISGYSEAKLVNVLIYGNWSTKGGGMFVEASNPTLVNVTIANNNLFCDVDRNKYFGKGIYSCNSILTLQNSIVDEGITIEVLQGFPSNQFPQDITAYNSLIQEVYVSHMYTSYGQNNCTYYPTYNFYNCMVGNVDFEAVINPPLPPICLFVYPNVTRSNCTGYSNPQFVNPTASSYRLRASSPCIDAGSQSFVNLYTKIDLDGMYRVAGQEVDMGAYEYGSTSAPPDIVNQKSLNGNNENNPLETTGKLELTVIPNPTNGSQTTVHLKDGSTFYENPVVVKVYAMDGRLVYSHGFSYGNIKADFSALAQGMYVLKLQTHDGENYKHKLFISK